MKPWQYQAKPAFLLNSENNSQTNESERLTEAPPLVKPWEHKPQPERAAEPTLYDRLRERVEASAWAIPSVDRLREFLTLAEHGDESARAAIEVYLEHPQVREELEASS